MRSAESELRHLESVLMRWPRSLRIQRKIQELRRQIERDREAQARNLRGRIRRSLMDSDLDTLARIARELVPAHFADRNLEPSIH